MQDSWVTSSAGLWLQAILVATAITLFGMTASYFQNLHEHEFSIFQLLPWTLGLWLGSAVLLFALTWAASVALPSTRYWLIPFIGILLWAQGAFNVPDYGPLHGVPLDWPTVQYAREIALLIAVSGMFLFLRHALKKHVFTVIGALFTVQLVYGLSAIFMAEQPMPRTTISDPPPEIHRLSSTENTFLIVLDEFQSDVFVEILQRRPELAEQLPGFVFFPDTVGTHPWTFLSLPSYFLGRPYRNEEPFREFQRDSFKSDSILADFSAAGYQVDLIRRPGLPASGPMDHIDHLITGGATESTSREQLEESLNLFEFTAFRHAPQLIRRGLYYHGIWTLSRLAYTGQLPSAPHRADLIQMKNLEQNAYIEGDQPVFRFIHFYTPHLPVVFDSELQTRTKPFSRDSVTDQSEAGIKLALRFLNILRAHGVYKNSRILIVADHGNRAGIGVHGHLPDMPSGPQQTDTASQAARVMTSGLPLLLAKNHGEKGDFRISRTPAHTLDITPSLVDGLTTKQKLEGYSLFSGSPDSVRDRHFYYYEWREHNWEAQFLDPIRVYRVDGHAWDADAWSGELTQLRPDFAQVRADRPPPERPEYTPGHMLDLRLGGNGEVYLGQGWHQPESNRRWTSGEIAEVFLPGDFDKAQDYVLRMAAQPFIYPGQLEQQRLKVLVNEEEIASLELTDPRRQQLRMKIPSKHMREGELRIHLITPDRASPVQLGAGDDQRLLGVSITHLVVE